MDRGAAEIAPEARSGRERVRGNDSTSPLHGGWEDFRKITTKGLGWPVNIAYRVSDGEIEPMENEANFDLACQERHRNNLVVCVFTRG